VNSSGATPEPERIGDVRPDPIQSMRPGRTPLTVQHFYYRECDLSMGVPSVDSCVPDRAFVFESWR
jgi:hypothetical protein